MILDIDPYIYKELINNSSLTNIIDNRLEKYFGEIDIEKPYVTYSIVPGSDEYRTKTKTNVIEYQFMIVAEDFLIAKAIKSAIFAILGNFGGRLGTASEYVTVIQAYMVNEVSFHDEKARIYRFVHDYKFIYRR